ncbi:MAG: nitroreductase [Kiritimatiellae bacterium]|nr:nitroreductase [Kiritimatiellia bacterium]
MTLDEIIKSRRSCRKFKPETPPREMVDAIIEAGLWAASGRGLQSPAIIAVTNPSWREEISALNAKIMGKDYEKGHGPDPLFNAPVYLMVIASTRNATAAYDGSLALGNMMLKAHELGLGTCWIHRAKQEMETPFGAKLLARLGLEGEWEGVGHLALGYPAEALPPPEAKPRLPNRAFYI